MDNLNMKHFFKNPLPIRVKMSWVYYKWCFYEHP